MDDRYISLLFNADLYFSTHKFSLTSVGNHGNGVRLGSLTRSMDQYKPFNGRIRKVSEEIPGIKWCRVTCPEDCMESNPGVRATLARESTWWLVIGRRYRLLILTHGSLGQSFEILTVRIGNIREPGALKNTKTCRDRSEFIDTYRGLGVVFLLKVTLQIC